MEVREQREADKVSPELVYKRTQLEGQLSRVQMKRSVTRKDKDEKE